MSEETTSRARSTRAGLRLVLSRLGVLALAGVLTGCATSGLVTGQDDTTRKGGQSETDATTSLHRGVQRIVVAYNDETGNQAALQYGPTSRKVLRGASLMGWSYSEDFGATWKYGGRLSPPRGWAVLWSDPALVTSRTQYGLVFLSNLAIPDAKFPEGGVSGSISPDPSQGSPVVGGACIARSTDGGVRFEHFQCVQTTEPVPGKPNAARGHFYDGGSMASGPGGEIFASFVDLDTNQVDIWRSPDGQQAFARMPSPFPSYHVASHPRIRVARDGTLYVMAIVKAEGGRSRFALVANLYRNGQWGDPKLILTGVELYPEIDLGSSVLGAPLRLRTGPQFSFDVGASSEDRDDSVRFLATQKNERDWLFVQGGICNAQLTSCGTYKPWIFGAAPGSTGERQRIEAFSPNVSAFPGFFVGIAPRWQATFLLRYGNSTTTLNLTRATLGYVDGAPFSIPVDIERGAPVCPDGRTFGYWGDYDGFLPVQLDGDRVRFMRFMTDSSLGCIRRWTFLGEHQHVRAVDYWY